MGKRLEQTLHKGRSAVAKNVHKKIPHSLSSLPFLGANHFIFCTTVSVSITPNPNCKPLESKMNI